MGDKKIIDFIAYFKVEFYALFTIIFIILSAYGMWHFCDIVDFVNSVF